MPPNVELMHRYGTDRYYLEKTGSIPMSTATALTGAAFMGYAAHDAAHVEAQRQEAALMNEMFRAREAARMAPAIAGFKGASVQLTEAQVKTAEAVGRALARLEAGVDKEAMALPFTGTARMMGALNKAEGVQTIAQKAKGFLQGPTKRMLAAGGDNVAGAAGAIQKAAPAAAAAAAPAAKAPLIGWKGKALAGGAVLGLGYAGAKTMGAARDFMMQPTQSQTWGQGGPSPKTGINEWGYPQ